MITVLATKYGYAITDQNDIEHVVEKLKEQCVDFDEYDDISEIIVEQTLTDAILVQSDVNFESA